MAGIMDPETILYNAHMMEVMTLRLNSLNLLCMDSVFEDGMWNSVCQLRNLEVSFSLSLSLSCTYSCNSAKASAHA